MESLRLPIGLCEVTYGDLTLNRFANSSVFNVMPKYKKLTGSFQEPVYILESYAVSLSLSLTFEIFENLKLAIPSLQEYDNGGFYDNPLNVNTEGKTLIIHPTDSGDSKEFDIVVFRAILDPENPYKRIYDKKQDQISVNFVGLPGKQLSNNTWKSYFYIGDWEASGVI